MEIAIVSDTHMPRGDRRLPASCEAVLRRADLIVHAGDFWSLAVVDEIGSLGTVVGVHGNVDEPAVRAALPETVRIEAGRWRIGVIHDAGPARGRLERLRKRFPDADAVVFGHSHLPLLERGPGGFQIFNPGSPTERRRAARHTMGIAHAREAELSFELVDLG